MKSCSKCKEIKTLNNFNFRKKHNRYESYCKECAKIYYNKEKRKIYNQQNKEKFQEYMKIYNLENKEFHKEYHKKHYILNKEKISKYQKQYYSIPENKIKKNNKIKENSKEKRKNDIEYKLKHYLRNRIWWALKNIKSNKLSSSVSLLGCNLLTYKQHIESQFLPEMTWENYGNIWEIDHIKACSNFDLTKLEEQHMCFHYTNLQPLFKTTEIAESFGYTDQIGNRNKYNK